MKNITKIALTSLVTLAAFAMTATPVFAISSPQVQTYAATNISTISAALNGNLYDLGGYGSATVWFQWGLTINYGNATNQTFQNVTGSFNQYISNLTSGQVYHFRAVAQNAYGTIYGQDMQFVSGYNGGGTSNNQLMVSAGPNLYINSNQNVVLQGFASSYNGGNITYSWACTGGTLSNQNIAQPVYTPPLFGGQATYTCSLYASNGLGQSGSSSTTVYVNPISAVLGATDVSTGLTNNLFTDSFFLPLVLIIAGFWVFKYKATELNR